MTQEPLLPLTPAQLDDQLFRERLDRLGGMVDALIRQRTNQKKTPNQKEPLDD